MRVDRLSVLLCAALLMAGCGGGGGGSSGGGSTPASPFAVANPFATAGATSVDEVRVDDLRVFGDSYSEFNYGGATTTWGTVLEQNGTAADLENYAIGGARAAPGFSNAFDRQLDTWESANSPIGARDLTAVYFGYNDLVADDPGRESGYRAGLDRLVAAGAAGADRKLFVTLLHDWSQNPSTGGVSRADVRNWNSFVAGIANSNDNIIAVDLFTVFDRIYDDPGAFGFSNVTTVDAANSDTTALYFDALHFGDRGQDVIARVYRHYLTRAWDWSNTLTVGSATASWLNQDIDTGVLVLGLDADTADQPLGFSSFTFGDLRPATGSTLPFADDGTATSPGAVAAGRDPSRASFAEAYGEAPSSGGVAFDYRPAQNQRFGVALARYESSLDRSRPETRLEQDQSSDAVALYWQQAHGGFTATTQFAYLQHNYADRGYDEDVGLQGTNRYTGSTWAVDQKLARPLRAAGTTVTPWASLGYQWQDLEPYEAKSLYTSDVSFSGASASDVTGAIGLDIRPDAIRLGGGRHLWLSGAATYRTSLYRDDVEVTMSEAAIPGVSQSETIERDRYERFDLSFAAVLGLSEDLNLRATYAYTTDQIEDDQVVRFNLGYRF